MFSRELQLIRRITVRSRGLVGMTLPLKTSETYSLHCDRSMAGDRILITPLAEGKTKVSGLRALEEEYVLQPGVIGSGAKK